MRKRSKMSSIKSMLSILARIELVLTLVGVSISTLKTTSMSMSDLLKF